MALENPLFILGPDIKSIFQRGIDTIIDQLGVDCTVVGPGPRTPCPNCTFDPAKNASSGRHKAGGPRPFSSGPCPVCKGSGIDPETLASRVVRKFSVRRFPAKTYPIAGGTVVKTASRARLKGLVSDADVLRNMHYVLITPEGGGLPEKYLPDGEVENTGSIVQGRYFTMFVAKADEK